jgi:hypothetical protein
VPGTVGSATPVTPRKGSGCSLTVNGGSTLPGASSSTVRRHDRVPLVSGSAVYARPTLDAPQLQPDPIAETIRRPAAI